MASSDACASHKESLMNEINNLFAPPTAESYGKKGLSGIPSARRSRKNVDVPTSSADLSSIPELLPTVIPSTYNPVSANRDDPFWRKPRPNCHEFCDSCGCTEGDRLVCDRCPASFHLECLDPPMDSEEAPIGVWFCHRCSRLLEDEEDQASTSSSQGTAATETGSTRSSRTGRIPGRKRDLAQPVSSGTGVLGLVSQQSQPSKRSACISRAVTNERALTGRSSRSAAWGESAYVADTEESELRALWNVIKYAQYQNPKEFDLPKDLLPGIKLPGSYKTVAERKAKPIIDLENGLIPRPIRRCFVCSRTCMFAPLLPCDYCSACFHLECLDPPLPHFPPRSDRWMCPNHIEHVADRYLVRSIRLTERMRIWSELTRFDSASQISRANIPPVVKVKKESEESDQQVCSLPHDEQNADSQDTFDRASRPETPPLDVVAPYELTYGPDEEAAILAGLMRRVQRGRAEQSIFVSSLISTTETLIDCGETGSLPASNCDDRRLWRLNRVFRPSPLMTRTDSDQVRIVVPPSVKAMYARGIKPLVVPAESHAVRHLGFNQDDKTLFVRGLLEFYFRTAETRPRFLRKRHNSADGIMDEGKSDSEKLPYNGNRLGTCKSKGEPDAGVFEQLSELNNCFNDLPPEKRAKFDLHLILSLARQRIDELFGRQTVRPLLLETVQSPSEYNHSSNRLRARAVFTPCGNTIGPVVRMHYRKLTIGTSPDCHLRLTDYVISYASSRCPYSSAHHATVFYDEWAHHFELLNYSEFGSLVDGIMFGNQLQPQSLYDKKRSITHEKVRCFVQHEHNNNDIPSSTKCYKMPAPQPEGFSNHCCVGFRVEPELELKQDGEHACNNLSDDADVAAWEGSAILRHGSVIQFGCYQFVMGLVDFTSVQ